MLQLLTSQQIREADAYTIKSKAISSVDLMESASTAFVMAFIEEIPEKDIPISIYCGTGNNGGDGLAIARLLKEQEYHSISVKIARFSTKETEDFRINLKRLALTEIPIIEITETKNFPKEEASIIIDALIGSGLNSTLHGDFQVLVNHLNNLNRNVIAVDIPSGLPSEGEVEPESSILKASLCISFQRPKINFFFPESIKACEHFKVKDIGLDEEYIQSQPSPWKLIEEKDLKGLIRIRKPFSHKGSYGHALIIAGDTKTMGAALLCADACVHSGAGLTTACIPEQGLSALNSYAPEVMTLSRTEIEALLPVNKYNSIAIGPGLGTDQMALKLIQNVLNYKDTPLVIDADALNILAENPELLLHIPEGSILCPHVKEFDRLFGDCESWWTRVAKAKNKAKELKIVILLKNQYSFIILPEGEVLINPTGNPAMAVGGMGDVLTGMIAAFFAQGYTSKEAAILGCYIHGKAGDVMNQKMGMYSIPPGELIMMLPEIISEFQ